MSSSRPRMGWLGSLFYLVLGIVGTLTIWYWPQSPSWRMVVLNPELNINKSNVLFFSEDSRRLFISNCDKDLRQAFVAHYDVHTGQLLERVELWHDRTISTGVYPPMILSRMPDHYHRMMVAIIHHTDGSRDIEYYDVYQGQKPVVKLNGINQVSHVLSKSRRWAQYFALDQKKQERPDLIIADTQTGEVVLHYKPDCDSAGKAIMAYGWMAVFDPTERFVAIDWNTLEGWAPGDPPEKHQSQIRIYDLQTRQEVRRLVLPPGSHWGIRRWEGDELWTLRTWYADSSIAFDERPIRYSSRENRLDLTQDQPVPVEYSQFCDEGIKVYHTRGANWLAFHDYGAGKKRVMPSFLRQLREWFPSIKGTIDEYFPEYGMKVWLADIQTGQCLWECHRLFNGSFDISPDGQWLVVTIRKKDAIEIEMWETHAPRRWVWVLGYLGLLGAWMMWRRGRRILAQGHPVT